MKRRMDRRPLGIIEHKGTEPAATCQPETPARTVRRMHGFHAVLHCVAGVWPGKRRGCRTGVQALMRAGAVVGSRHRTTDEGGPGVPVESQTSVQAIAKQFRFAERQRYKRRGYETGHAERQCVSAAACFPDRKRGRRQTRDLREACAFDWSWVVLLGALRFGNGDENRMAAMAVRINGRCYEASGPASG